MPTLAELKPHGCRYPLDERGQFCGVRQKRKLSHERERSSYCLYHHGICHSGFGKDWSALVKMMNAKEHTVLTRRERADLQPAVDEAIREGVES